MASFEEEYENYNQFGGGRKPHELKATLIPDRATERIGDEEDFEPAAKTGALTSLKSNA